MRKANKRHHLLLSVTHCIGDDRLPRLTSRSSRVSKTMLGIFGVLLWNPPWEAELGLGEHMPK